MTRKLWLPSKRGKLCEWRRWKRESDVDGEFLDLWGLAWCVYACFVLQLFCLLNLCDDYWMWCNQRSSFWAGISQAESEPRSDTFNQEVLLWERGRGAPGMHTEKGSALSPWRRRRRMVTLQVPHQSPKRTFSVVFDQWHSHDNLQQHEEKRCKKLKTGDRITPHLCSVHTEWWQETGSSTSVILRRKNQVMTTL